MTSTTDLVSSKVASAIDKIREGDIASIDAVVKIVGPDMPAANAPEHVPLPAVISESQREALERLGSVFGQVVPIERRALAVEEVTALLTERSTLDEIEKLAKARKDDIRTTVFNHLDVEVESDEVPDDAERDGNGHYIIKGEVRGEAGQETRFSREVRKGSASLSVASLLALSEDPEIEWFTHEDYLTMTTQTRVFDENKAMLALKKNPELVRAIAQATTRSAGSASLYQRRA